MKILKEDNIRSSEGWEVKYDEEDDLLQELVDNWGAEDVLEQITRAMSTDELAGYLAFICRMNGYENSHIVGYNEGLEESLNESVDGTVIVELDEDDAVELLVDRLKSRWTQDPIACDLYREMYTDYISNWDENKKIVPSDIVDNDYVNYCEVVKPGDEEHHYDKILEIYEEQGIGDISEEDASFSFIEAAYY